MNDYNRGALPDPCLRLDYGFGEEWASVELGDGTGYVRLADYERAVAENAELKKAMDFQALELGCMTDNRDVLHFENKNLRELVRDMWRFTVTACKKYPKLFDQSAQGGQMVHPNQIDSFEQRMRELGLVCNERQ